MQNKTNSAEAQTQLEPNVQALAPSMAHSELNNLNKNSEAIDGCQQRPCSVHTFLNSLSEEVRHGDDGYWVTCGTDEINHRLIDSVKGQEYETFSKLGYTVDGDKLMKNDELVGTVKYNQIKHLDMNW